MAPESAWNAAIGLLERLPVGVLQTDARGICTAINPRALEILELAETEAHGDGWLQALDSASRETLLSRLAQSRGVGGTISVNLHLSGDATRPRVLSCRAVPISHAGVTDSGYLTTLLDVTYWHQGEEDLRRTTRELAFRVRELDCLFEISRSVERFSGNLGAILREVVQILARTWSFPEQGCAQIFLDGQTFETENYRPCTGMRREPIYVHGEEVGEIRVGQPDSSSSDEARLSPMEEERLLETVAQRLGRTAERVRGRRLLQEKEEEMRERLTHLTRVSTMGEMASSIAHEVNQPLTAIATYAQACRRLLGQGETDEGELRDVLGRISTEALRAGTIVHRLKDLVRRQETRWTECDLNSLIRDVEQLASVDARLHDVSLQFELAQDLPAILADGVQLQQVILNLIRNGIDAVEESQRPDGVVAVRTALTGEGKVSVSVEDNGCGLPEQADQQVFQPFFTTKKGGMGMGLSISKSIAKSHKGQIFFARNDGPGMTFTLTLPALDET